jgi:TonB family protein
MIADSLMPKPKNDDDKWRTVAVLQPQSKMMTPSAATLKKYLYDWNKKRRGNESPSIRIRFGDEQKAAINSLPPMPQVRQEPKVAELVLPANTLASGDASTSSAPGQSGSGAPVVSGRGVGLGVTPPEPAPPKSEMAENSVPKSIPSGITPPASTPPAPAGGFRVFETEQKAIYSPDSGIFDTKGFPLGEYVNILKERIKGNWFIPSNLQNFQGHTTIIFYIDRGGRYANARIVKKSGSNSFDNAALMAVITSDPFPPLPEGFPGKHIGAKFVLSWNEP